MKQTFLTRTLYIGALCAFPLFLSAPVYAQEATSPFSVSASAAFKTDYVFRGFSQTDEAPAVQGSIAVAHESGLSASLWGSNVDFNDGDEASAELDGTLSYSTPLGIGNVTVGGTYYGYPNANSDLNYDYIEGFAGYAFKAADVADINAQVFYSPDFFAGSGNAVYTTVSVSVPVPAVKELSFNGSVGHQWIADEAAFGAPDYTDWSLGAAYQWDKVTLGLTYTDTDVENNSLADPRAVASLSYAF